MSQVITSCRQPDMLAILAEIQRDRAAAAAVRAAVAGWLGETLWFGTAAETFRDRWSQDFDPMLQRLEQELGELGGYVVRKRQQLHEAGNL